MREPQLQYLFEANATGQSQYGLKEQFKGTDYLDIYRQVEAALPANCLPANPSLTAEPPLRGKCDERWPLEIELLQAGSQTEKAFVDLGNVTRFVFD